MVIQLNMFQKNTLLFILVTIPFLGFTQWYNPDKVNKKAGALYGKAYEEAQDQKYESSIAKINQAIKNCQALEKHHLKHQNKAFNPSSKIFKIINFVKENH